jgi:hypothetical protein
MNVLQTLELVKEFKKSTNESLYKMWVHSVSIYQSGVWQKEEYYKGADNFAHLAEGSFADFYKEIFGYTIHWYERMWQIHKLKNGEELFARYGYGNMVTYVKSTEQEQKAILIEAEKSLNTVTFYNIKFRLFPKKKAVNKDVDKMIDINALMKENTLLKQKLEDAKATYAAQIKEREAQIHELKQKYLEEVEKHSRNIEAMRLTFSLMNGSNNKYYGGDCAGAA